MDFPIAKVTEEIVTEKYDSFVARSRRYLREKRKCRKRENMLICVFFVLDIGENSVPRGKGAEETKGQTTIGYLAGELRTDKAAPFRPVTNSWNTTLRDVFNRKT